MFLLPGRELGADPGKSCFPLVNRLFFEMKRNVLESMILES